ncbi:unnamed protein product, partial [Rotaria sp. Silwood1]
AHLEDKNEELSKEGTKYTDTIYTLTLLIDLFSLELRQMQDIYQFSYKMAMHPPFCFVR